MSRSTTQPRTADPRSGAASSLSAVRPGLRLDRLSLALGAIYLAYLASRLLLVWRLPVFWDEGFYAVEAQTGLDHPGQRFQFLADGKPPLFNWVSIVFVHLGITPLTAVRMVSFVAGLVTLTAVMLIARRLSGITGALVAGTLYVVLPYDLVYNSYGLIDGMFTAAAMVTLYLQIRLATRPSVLTAIGTGVALGAAILTRQTGELGILLLPLSLLLFDWAAPGRGRRLLRWTGCAGLALLISFTINLVTRLSPLRAVLSDPSQARSPDQAIKAPFAYLSGSWPGFSTAMTGYFGWPMLLVLAAAIAIAVVRRDRLALLLVPWAAGPALSVLLLVRTGYPRYALSAVPPMVVLIGYATVTLARAGMAWSGRRRAARALVTVVVAAMLVVPLVVDGSVLADPSAARYPAEDRYQYVAGWPAGTGLDAIKQALVDRAAAGSTLVIAVRYTPWNLAAMFDRPERIPTGTVPPLDAVEAWTTGGRRIEFATASPANVVRADFVLQHGAFALPAWLNLSDFHLVASFVRPGGGSHAGVSQPGTTVQLYERNH